MDDLEALRQQEATLVDILDRVLNKGVVVSGDVVISVADVDLVYLGVKVLLTSVENMRKMQGCPSHLLPEHNDKPADQS